MSEAGIERWESAPADSRFAEKGETLGDLIATLGSIDDDEIDWPNVRQTTVLIQQSFSYEYPGPITALRHRLMVVPPDYHEDQRLLTHKIRVSGCDVDTERSYDTFGNVVLDVARTALPEGAAPRVRAAQRTVDRIARTYGDCLLMRS